MTAATPLARELALALADALSYPDAALPERLRARSARLAEPQRDQVREMAERLAALGPDAAQELYTATFDLGAAVSPYVGEHLCSGPRRNALIAWLAERRAAAGLPPARELPDHFSELLRHVAAVPGGSEAEELATLALAPAARRAAAALAEDHPYRVAFEMLAAVRLPGAEEAAS